MTDPRPHFPCLSMYLTGLSKPFHPHINLGLSASHQNGNIQTAIKRRINNGGIDSGNQQKLKVEQTGPIFD